MDKITMRLFEFPNGNMFCVGSEQTINDIYNNFIIQRDRNKSIELKEWYNRIIHNRIYCRFEPKGIHGLYILACFYYKMKKNNLWITESELDEAMYLSNPEVMKELLGITAEEAECIKRKSIWNERFLH